MKNLRLAPIVALLALATAGVAAAQTAPCGSTSWDLTAGQTHDVGTVTVANDLDNVYVTYTLDDPDFPDATLGNLHLWIGNSLLNMPQNQNGTPIPGQFCQADGGACFDAGGLETYTFTVPFSELNIVDAEDACGEQLYVVTHAEVDLDGDPGTTGHETAFGGDTPGGGPRWWFYGLYTICCENGPPPVPVCETAFAKGGWIWTTDRKSNPENLPSLRLTKNRWGWAIDLATIGTSTYDVWAGAGLNNTANGTLVGTLQVAWDGTNVTVTYDLFAGFALEEVHVYAGDGRPATIAPGQYGFVDEPVSEPYSVTLPLSDSDGTPGVWIVAHAAVCAAP